MTRIRGGPRWWLLAAGGLVLAAAAGCQSSPDPGQASPATGPAVVQTTPPDAGVQGAPAGRTSPAPSPKTGATDRPPSTPPTPPRCHTADLALEVGQADSGAGHTGLNLALVNTSTHRCRIYGYGGVQLLDAAGAALPTHQARVGPAPELMTLRPGQRAYSSVTWLHTPEAPPCSNASFLQIIPPDETAPIRTPFNHTVCGNDVLSQGAYQGTPV
jgi:Protein of unknown function (DUF4232)